MEGDLLPLKIMSRKTVHVRKPKEEDNMSEMETTPSSLVRESDFKSRQHLNHHTTVVYFFRSAPLAPNPWIVTAVNGTLKPQLPHPLTLNPHHCHLSNFPIDFDLLKLKPVPIAVSHHSSSLFDKFLLVPHPIPKGNTLIFGHDCKNNLNKCDLLVLYNGGHLQGCPSSHHNWSEISEGGIDKVLCDDITIHDGQIYALDRNGVSHVVHNWSEISEGGIDKVLCDDITIHDGQIYALDRNGVSHVVHNWSEISEGGIDKVLCDDITIHDGQIYALDRNGVSHVVHRNHSLKQFASSVDRLGQFGWRKRLVVEGKQLYLVVKVDVKLLRVYKLVHPRHWERVRGFHIEQLVLFMARDYCFFLRAGVDFPGKEYENCILFREGAFPRYGKDCWEYSPQQSPDEISVFRLTDEIFGVEGKLPKFPKINWSPPDWVRPAWLSDIAESQSPSQSESGSKDEDSDSNSRHSDSDAEEDEEQLSRTLLQMNVGNTATNLGKSMKSISQPIPITCTSSAAKRHKTESSNAKFEGFVINSNLVPTLQEIRTKHGNITGNSCIRNSEIVAVGLKMLVKMVWILDDNSGNSLSDSDADYLKRGLSDLTNLSFNVGWLSPHVERAVQIQESKPHMESMNNLRQSDSQLGKRKENLMAKLAEVEEEKKKLKEKMANVSKRITISGQVNLDEPLWSGLT